MAWIRASQGGGGTDKADISAIAPNEPNATASQAYAAGEHFYKNGKFCTAKTAIASGATFTLGTNYVEGMVAEFVGFPLISEMTTPTIYNNTVKNLVGGYKQVGKTVYVDMSFELAASFTPTQQFPLCNYYRLIDYLPKNKNEVALNTLYRRASDNRPVAGMNIFITVESNISILCLTMNTGYAPNSNDKVCVRGTYEAE